jgi:hypothetical protein
VQRSLSPMLLLPQGLLICDLVRGWPVGRLKSLVMPEISVMSLQLFSVEERSTQRQAHTRVCVSVCVWVCVCECVCHFLFIAWFQFPEWMILEVGVRFWCVCVCFLCVCMWVHTHMHTPVSSHVRACVCLNRHVVPGFFHNLTGILQWSICSVTIIESQLRQGAGAARYPVSDYISLEDNIQVN